MTCKVVIDTDAGVDDAVALFLALAAHKNPGIPFEIVGITTVLGNTDLDHVCRNVFLVLESAGIAGIPVYRGAATSLVKPFSRPAGPAHHGEDGFGEVDPSTLKSIMGPRKMKTQEVEEEPAALALVRLAREFKGELTLIALGPLTNVALAINLDPRFVTNVKDVYVMGGTIHGIGNIQPSVEFNFFVDPESAYVVLSARWNKSIVLVPWETCKDSMIPLKWRREVLGALKSRQMRLVNAIEARVHRMNEVKYGTGKWISSDSVCMAVLLRPEIAVKSITKYCTVELQGSVTRGQVVIDHAQRTGMPHNVTIVEGIDTAKLEDLFLSTFDVNTFEQE